MKCAGLTADQLKTRSVPPSGLSLLGLVRHMVEVERWWFRIHAGGQQTGFHTARTTTRTPTSTTSTMPTRRRISTRSDAKIEAARAAAQGKSLEDVVPSRGHHPERTRDLRWIYLHMIEEYARHNGHADLLRECIDGATGD